MHLHIIIFFQYIDNPAPLLIFKEKPVIIVSCLKKFLWTGHQVNLVPTFFKKIVHCLKTSAGPLIIRIQKIYIFSLYILHSVISRRTDAFVFLLQIKDVIRIFFCIFQTDFFAVIRTSVIDKDNLDIIFKANALPDHGVQCFREISFHIINRDHDRKFVFIIHVFSPFSHTTG